MSATSPHDPLLTRYIELVQQYSGALNLTAFKGANELQFELIEESLRLLQLWPIEDGWRCADLGSGAGSPVIPLAIACQHAEFYAVESHERRATFLRQVKAQLALSNLHVLEQRTEMLMQEQPASFDLVTARAYAAPQVLLAHARALLVPGGELRGYLGGDDSVLKSTAQEHGFTVEELREYAVGEGVRHIYQLMLTGI